MKNKARYFDEINILRAFAILAVISIHVSDHFKIMGGITLLTLVYMAIDAFCHFAVPLFICISGFVLYNKYSGAVDVKTFYEKRMKSVLPQYLIFSTFYLGVTYAGSLVLGTSVSFDIPHIIYRYLTGGCYYHLWFFVLIIQFYLLYPAIVRIYDYCTSRGQTSALLFASFLIGVIYNSSPIPDVYIMGTATPILGVATLFIGYLFYFILGMVVLSRYDEVLKYVPDRSVYWMAIPLICGTVLGIFGYAQKFFAYDLTLIHPFVGQYWQYIAAALTPLFYVLIFALCLSLSLHLVANRTRNVILLEKIGHYSFGIYLVHASFVSLFVVVFPYAGFDWNDWLFYPVTFCLVLILSYLSVEILQKLPYSKYIIGTTR
ncbi:acyltransferase [Methanogenium sp. S4BF]|uniref:acyltransferase n=1 Tax=Methanogenium sp. S4BF TaxID=1789226 RepID=UPI00241648C4|nr:acyltransferase [Methanogenium sp. S4BF]WFN33444.1 acyltransferase [Methanogenium sp. S4BF]